MTTPEVPAIDLLDAPAAQPNPLFENLVPATPQTRADTGKLTFADAMPRMGMSSVFDIIREPKQAFATRLRTLSDADGEMAYDNALCYASQIARSFREEQVSSGRNIATSSQRSGVRALVDIGPSYPNLFQENWDEFCKVGAIEAMDGPVAYLGALRRFAAEKIEGNSTSPRRIPLAVRRPDLDQLVIDEQSTYRPIPMLDLVNDVLTQGIDKYQKEKGDERPVQQLLAEKKHPFVFPYHFAHKQVNLVLGGEKPGLGELSYRISLALPGAGSAYGNVNRNNYSAQLAMSGLSPSLQNLLQAPSLFSHFYVSFYDLLNTSDFEGPDVYSLRPYNTAYVGFLLQPQTSVGSIEPEAASLMWQDNRGSTDVELLVCKAGSTKSLPLKFGARGHAFTWPMNYALDATNRQRKTLSISYPGAEDALSEAVGHSREVSILAKSWSGLESWSPTPFNVAPWRLTFTADADYSLTPEQQSFFQDHYGKTFSHASTNPLTSLEHFLQSTGLDSDRLEALLAVKSCSPIKTPHWKVLNPAAAVIPFPRSNHYGACYVNGVGGRDSGTHQYNSRDNAMGVSRESGSQKWRLTNTSLERFDRLQRMIRLQKATGLPFAQLDTLLIGSMRSEGDANAALQINANTLRALGTFRYFDKHYRIDAEEFAAFLYHISPHATTGQVPLLDKVFNTPLLFDKPLIIDDVEFTLDSALPADQQTIAQLCASLGVQPGTEFERMTVQRYQGCADGTSGFHALADFAEAAELDETALRAYDDVLEPAQLEAKLLELGYTRMPAFLPEEPARVLWSVRQGYATYGPAEAFYRVQAYRPTPAVGETRVEYDAYQCLPVMVIAADGCTTQAAYDYRHLQPMQVIDANDNRQQASYDAFGRVSISTFFGTEMGEPVGFAPLQGQTMAGTIGEAITDNAAGLGDWSMAYIHESDSWMGQPPPTGVTDVDALAAQVTAGRVTLAGLLRASARQQWHRGLLAADIAEALAPLESYTRQPVRVAAFQADRYPGDPQRQVRMSMESFDGFGRSVQSKQRVEPGLAHRVNDEGELLAGDDAHADPRWRVSERVEYDTKGQVIRVYRPYFANSDRYINDDSHRDAEHSYHDLQFYDALGRPTETWTAAGWLRRQRYTPWYSISEDENDTAEEVLAMRAASA